MYALTAAVANGDKNALNSNPIACKSGLSWAAQGAKVEQVAEDAGGDLRWATQHLDRTSNAATYFFHQRLIVSELNYALKQR
eukprot:753790-Hanusia_phi.AAC.4